MEVRCCQQTPSDILVLHILQPNELNVYECGPSLFHIRYVRSEIKKEVEGI